jgi:glutamate racemase
VVLGKNVTLIDSAKQVAIEVKEVLSTENLLNNNHRGNRHKFYVSDNPEWFSSIAERFLGSPIRTVEKVNNV